MTERRNFRVLYLPQTSHMARVPVSARARGPEQGEEVIYAVRRTIEPSLNWAMEEKVVKIGLALPVVGKLGIGNLRFNLRGTRVAMRSLRGRLLRLAVQGVLWLAVAAGTVHWMSWAFFDEPYLASTFDGWAQLTQFIRKRAL